MQPLFAYNALIWKTTITILTLILFVVFLVRGLYPFAVLEKHFLKSNQGLQYQQQARVIRNSFCNQPAARQMAHKSMQGHTSLLPGLPLRLPGPQIQNERFPRWDYWISTGLGGGGRWKPSHDPLPRPLGLLQVCPHKFVLAQATAGCSWTQPTRRVGLHDGRRSQVIFKVRVRCQCLYRLLLICGLL